MTDSLRDVTILVPAKLSEQAVGRIERSFNMVRIERAIQQAVSKRKRKIIRKLRRLLRDARAAMLLSSTLFWSAVADPIELPLSCDLWL